MGITIKTLSDWRGKPVTKHEVMMLDDVEARAIYEEMYWVAPKFDQLGYLGDVVTELLFDTAVHSGPHRAARLFQKAVGVKVDGQIGPKTRKAAEALTRQELVALILGERVMFLGRLITQDRSQAVFAAGWMKRMADFINLVPFA